MSKYDIDLNRKMMDPLNIILDRIKPNSTVLEFGCASGRMTKYMQEQLGCKVYIVEMDKNDFQQATCYTEGGLCGDISKLEWLDEFKEVSFDYMIFADVLEHLTTPERVLAATKLLLKDEGEVWISVPNIAHNDILLNLYEDSFRYTNTGLLDNTHVHFWGINSLHDFCSCAGYGVVFEDCTSKQTNCTEQRNALTDIELSVFMQEVEKREFGEVYQYVFGLKKMEYIQRLNLKKETHIDEHSHIMERRIFLDLGEGFSGEKNCHIYYDTKKKCKFCVRTQIPEETQKVRFDPVEMMPCRIGHLEILSNQGILEVNEGNSVREGEAFIFRNLDPQIIIDVKDKDINWIQFSGEIQYDYAIMDPELGENRDVLERIQEDNSLLQAKVSELCDELNYEKEISIRRDKNITFLTAVRAENEEEIEKLKMQLGKKREEYLALENESREKLEHIKAENIELKQRIEGLQDQKKQYMKEQERLQQENLQLSLEQKRLSHQMNYRSQICENVADELQNNRMNLYCLKKVYGEAQTKLDAIENSNFWKITKPARRACDLLKRMVGVRAESILDSKEEEIFEKHEWSYDLPMKEIFPLVSVIVPNYNHAPYLRERLESIYAQTYENFEVILLDDCSTDNSREILNEYAEKYSGKTILAFNDENTGQVLKQWNKGLGLAHGKYIWIAESDDYCENDFLEKLVPMLDAQSVMLVFARSVFVQEGEQIWSSEEYLADIPEINWKQSFSMTAHDAVRLAFSQKNIVPNVSSALFRNIGELPEEVCDLWLNHGIKLSGDWLFYLYLIKGGCISYTTETTNYYRIHKESTSLRIQKTQSYYKDFEEVAKYVVENFKIEPKTFEKVQNNLIEHYKAIHEVDDDEAQIVKEFYSLDKIKKAAEKRKPNVLMACFSMKMGGGETYPLYLANEMKQQGIPVTVLDFRMNSYDRAVRNILRPDVPLIEIRSLDYLKQIIEELGGDIVHSHHASVDEAVSTWILNSDLRCKQIISLHGMYEAIEPRDCERVLENVTKSCAYFVYTADKNLGSLKKYDYINKIKLIKIMNGLPRQEISKLDRAQYGIPEDAFVLCLVSRAIPEKGWAEAVEAVKKANDMKPKRPVHLLLIGDGEMKNELEKKNIKYVHFLGTRSNIRDFFAMADAGFLPTRFPGESFPLVVIDSLMSNRPVIATDLGEIKAQLTIGDGSLAGELLSLVNWKLDTDEIAAVICKIANDLEYDKVLRARTKEAASKFDIEKIVKQYLEIYEKVLEKTVNEDMI